MTDQQQIVEIRSLSLTQLAELRAAPKPTYWIDGQRVHWEQYADSLQRTVDWCDRKLADGAPFEIHSRGTT